MTRIGRDADDCLVNVALGELDYLVSPAPTLPPRCERASCRQIAPPIRINVGRICAIAFRTLQKISIWVMMIVSSPLRHLVEMQEVKP